MDSKRVDIVSRRRTSRAHIKLASGNTLIDTLNNFLRDSGLDASIFTVVRVNVEGTLTQQGQHGRYQGRNRAC